MKFIGVYVPEGVLEKLDQLVSEYYPNRAEAIRFAIQDLVKIHHCKTLIFLAGSGAK